MKTNFCFNGFSKETLLRALRNMLKSLSKKEFREFISSATFVDAEYKLLGKFRVSIGVPDPGKDKYMSFNTPSHIICWENRENKKTIVLQSEEHWTRNLLVNGLEPGTHSTIRRIFRGLEPSDFGQTILADVTIHQQKNYHTGAETIVMDFQVCSDDYSELIYNLGQGVKTLPILPVGVQQFKIPGTDKAVRVTPQAVKKQVSDSIAA